MSILCTMSHKCTTYNDDVFMTQTLTRYCREKEILPRVRYRQRQSNARLGYAYGKGISKAVGFLDLSPTPAAPREIHRIT